MYTPNTEEKKDEMKLQILGVIDVKRLNEIRTLEEKLKKEENRGAIAAIELEIQELMDIDALYKSYIKQENALKTELSNDIREYLTETIKQIAIDMDVNMYMYYMYKQTIKESCSDAFGGLYTKHTRKSHAYSFSTYFKYTPKVIELECRTTLEIYGKLCSLENKQFGVFERKDIVRAIAELERENDSNSKERLNPTLFYVDITRDSGIHLLDPLMHISEYKVYIIWALLMHAIDRNLDSNHPFVRLADNLLESARFMDSKNKNEMFMVLSLISVNKYYPHITIDKHAYEKKEYFAKVIEKVLELANNTEHVSHKTYADIISKLIIRLQRICLENGRYSELESLTCNLNDTYNARRLFIKILTLNGTNLGYITRIVQSTQEMEKTHPANGCKSYNNVFLMWIIQNTSESKLNYWRAMVKGCYDLINTTEFKDNKHSGYSFVEGINLSIQDLFSSIKT
ncbi:hypothetical protein NEAUS03_2273 [Nematocida ausubeli]|nr:hypothetical protein NEAUS03_2273 [Nematocida ausubeli]